MRIAGTATLNAPVDAVYAALQDPRVLVRTIPGCVRLEQVGEDAYAMTVTAGVASVRGTYAGDVRLSDHRAPHRFTLRADGSGSPGTIAANVSVELAEGDGGTTVLSYDADAVVGGMIGGVGQRLLTTVAKRTASEFFTAVDGVLAGGGVEDGGTEPAAGPDAADAPLPGPTAAGALSPGTGVAGAAARAAGEGAGPRGDSAPAGPRVYTAPPRPRAALPGGEFAAGVALGAAAALLGALVGGYLARRARRR
jgi:carbon monoxide dehydrogenase subunit G